MDLFIETLTGTAFELRVSPYETIMNVKAKIQRLEGIPISQQHLIWRSVELEDDCCLQDYDINDGATLQLVLAMRGGPINMKRVPVEDNSLREMAEYVEANRDEIWDKLPKDNRQVTFLVFREGEQYNVYRVVDRGDGTLTPLSDSLSGASLYNLYDEDDEENSITVPQETVLENNVTMNKMKLLKSKMQSLNMSKKSRGGGTSVEQVSFQPHSRPPSGRIVYQPRPPSKEKHCKHQPRPPTGEKPSRRFSGHVPCIHQLGDNHETPHMSMVGTSSKKEPYTSSKGLPPVNKTKKSNNIDISELVRNPPDDSHFESGILLKHFNHENDERSSLANDRVTASLGSNASRVQGTSHGLGTSHNNMNFSRSLRSSHVKHKPLPNVRKHSENMTLAETTACDPEMVNLSKNKSGSLQGHGYSTNRGIRTLKDRNMSVERMRTGHLTDSLSRMHRTQQGSAGTSYPTSEIQKHRPPPPPQLVSAKKTRCTFCRKKIGLATTYVCRCGNSFCATHRYAETHNCNYDYKTEGRTLLEQSNPLVIAPKLPKI